MTPPRQPSSRWPRPLKYVRRTTTGLLTRVAFWIGVALPLVYVPSVLVGAPSIGLRSLVGLVGLNYLALIVGARHPDRSTEAPE